MRDVQSEKCEVGGVMGDGILSVLSEWNISVYRSATVLKGLHKNDTNQQQALSGYNTVLQAHDLKWCDLSTYETSDPAVLVISTGWSGFSWGYTSLVRLKFSVVGLWCEKNTIDGKGQLGVQKKMSKD